MIDAGLLVSLISLTASLFLSVRAFRAHGLAFENTAWFAVAWTLIIALVAFVATRMGV